MNPVMPLHPPPALLFSFWGGSGWVVRRSRQRGQCRLFWNVVDPRGAEGHKEELNPYDRLRERCCHLHVYEFDFLVSQHCDRCNWHKLSNLRFIFVILDIEAMENKQKQQQTGGKKAKPILTPEELERFLDDYLKKLQSEKGWPYETITGSFCIGKRCR